MEELLRNRNGGKTLIKQRAIGMVVNGKRRDRHGVLELFKELTDLEKEKRQEAAKKIAKDLAA